MIICPNCKEEIEDDSHYCDQCGEALVYCSSCGRVGLGRRCTHCGGLMVSIDELQKQQSQRQQVSVSVHQPSISMHQPSISVHQPSFIPPGMSARRAPEGSELPSQSGIPTLTLYNPTLDIRMVGVNGAIIGRRQGPYQQLFEGNMYISGVHAQLIYRPDSGWAIIDKHSSNGTKLNQRDVQPDVPMTIKAGDIVTLANINLQVSIS